MPEAHPASFCRMAWRVLPLHIFIIVPPLCHSIRAFSSPFPRVTFLLRGTKKCVLYKPENLLYTVLASRGTDPPRSKKSRKKDKAGDHVLGGSVRYPRMCQELFIRLYRMRYKLSVAKQRVSCNGGRRALCLFFALYVNGL